jgi:hypothetical protein
MKRQPDYFRDFGVIPHGVAPPPETVRSYLPWGHIIGQYVFTSVMAGFGVGIATLFAFTLPLPANALASAVTLGGFGYLVYLATRNDYSWVELDGETLRARHLYTQRVIERSIDEIEDLLTLVFQIRTAAVRITESWLGRVRGIEIRFRDKRTPFRVCRADPKMRNAKKLIEAIVYRMSQMGEVDAEMIDFEGKPMIRRIHWRNLAEVTAEPKAPANLPYCWTWSFTEFLVSYLDARSRFLPRSVPATLRSHPAPECGAKDAGVRSSGW